MSAPAAIGGPACAAVLTAAIRTAGPGGGTAAGAGRRGMCPVTRRAWHDSYVPVILLVAAAAILGCVVLAALGRAGEVAAVPSDSPPPRVDQLTAARVAV